MPKAVVGDLVPDDCVETIRSKVCDKSFRDNNLWKISWDTEGQEFRRREYHEFVVTAKDVITKPKLNPSTAEREVAGSNGGCDNGRYEDYQRDSAPANERSAEHEAMYDRIADRHNAFEMNCVQQRRKCRHHETDADARGAHGQRHRAYARPFLSRKPMGARCEGAWKSSQGQAYNDEREVHVRLRGLIARRS